MRLTDSKLSILEPGCLLDGVAASAPPDVPPRNPTMNRMNGRVTGNPSDLGVDFEPSCLVRTPSGSVYIPNLNINKGSPIDYKSGSACSTPTKDTLKSYDRNYSGPVLPPRSAMCGAPSHHYSAPLNFRKGIAAKCSWKCTAIAVILLSAVLLLLLILITGSNVLTWSNPACSVLVGENSEITAAKSTVPETNDKSTANRAKPSISSTSSPSSSAAAAAAGNPAANGNNGATDISSQATGSTSSIGGNLNKVSDQILHPQQRQWRKTVVVVANGRNMHETRRRNQMLMMMMMMRINGQNQENNVKDSTKKKLMTKLNEQSVHEISANGEQHFNLETAQYTFPLSGKDAEMRIFTPNHRNSVNGQSERPEIVAQYASRQRRSAATVAFETPEMEGSGFDNVNVPFDGYTVNDGKEEDIENDGNSWDSPIPLRVNNARYQFDDSDTDDETTDVKNQRRKFDLSNLMLDENEPPPLKTTTIVKMVAAPAQVKAITTKSEDDLFASDLHVTNVDGNENGNSPSHSPAPNDFNESFELITDSIHETLVSENVVNDSHHKATATETTNDIIQTSSQMPSVLNWTSSDNNLTPQPLIMDAEGEHRRRGSKNVSANGMKFDDDTFVDKIDHKPEVNDATLQNDSPAIIVQYDKQPILEVNNLDTTTDSIGVDEHVAVKKQRHNDDNAVINPSMNVDMNANDDSNAKHAINKTDKPPHSIEENSIDRNAAYVETMSGTKYQEPRYGMLDSNVAHHDLIRAKDVAAQNMQRILVNVSIGTDSGDGTQNHGIYMLHVSVPAGPNLKPAYFDGDPPPQTAVHEPPIFIKPTPHRISNDENDDNDKVASAPSQPIEQSATRADPAECSSLTRKSAELVLECSNEISRLNSIIANLNKTMERTNSFEPSSLFSSPSPLPSPSALPGSSSRTNDSLIATKTEGNAANEPEMLTTTANTIETVSDYKGNDNHINNNNFGLCNQDIPSILILEGARTFPARSFPPDGTTFSQITLGQKLSKQIQPYSYWNMQFYQSEPAYVKFDYNIPRGASIGVYARRNALPTHTQYHFKEVLSGINARTTRSTHQPSVSREVTRYMENGHWFISLYNDDGDEQEITFYAAVADDMTQNCPNGCSGNGQCLLGHCQCNPGFGGDDCSESVCPVLCSQRGEYINGECQCNPGWKGKECSLRHDECEIADCNGHGHCLSGKCQCIRGYKGASCEEVDCPHPTCSGHGYCAAGTCICKKGWKGPDCGTMDQDALQCLPDCSGHGTFDLDTQTCNCEPKWSGDDCSKELCDLNCGSHGKCVGETCTCDSDWSGEYCTEKRCDARCNEHGQCKNGTCLCVTGWNGKHCGIEGCPASCSNHGQCRVSVEGLWECRCYDGWDGADCSVALEQNCADNKDNDKDGLVDCEDPECCLSSACRSSQLCVSAPKPIDVLLRKQPPAITASFFERMKFLIDEGSLQNYAKLETFNESRSAVIRGRVVTSMNMGLVGVRVSTSTPLEGFTLTRDDGWFDLMVNGGGAITLQFGRSPFRPQSVIVQVPWNEVIIIDTVVMSTSEDKSLATATHTCVSHDYDTMKPVVLASWKHGFQGACPDRSAILAESQVVQESLQIPGTGLNLVYHSSRAAGYLSTIKLQLTPEVVPSTLSLIHLRITIEGILFERVFEADPGIKFTYAWNRLNIYRQRVYGVTTAIVKVGYQYADCKDIIWDVQTTKLNGHDMTISEVGGWNIDVHHRYNFHEGILQKGDGSNIYLKNKPRVILTAMGDGHQRPLECVDCNGISTEQRLLAPVALAAGSDGSLYVGDFNYIRRIMTDGIVKTVVILNATRVSYRYHMAISPLDGSLYISDPESHQIIKVRNVDDFGDPEHNWEPVVGSGERCLPADEAHCGDGRLASEAKLAYPKGIAIASDNTLYFADGTNIRMVDKDGIVSTIIGNHMHKSHWKPMPCEGTLKVDEMHLRWPTELAVNPLDNTLHIIDDHMILRIAPDGRIRVVAGRPLHCTSTSTQLDSELAVHATLVRPQSIAFGPLGDLFVAESDSQRINRIRVIGTDGKITLFAGAESKCNCLERGCDCFEADHFLATSAKFNTIAALAITPDNHVHIADQANYRIRSVMSSIPEASVQREYEIFAPDTQEIYIFNRFGQHIATKNIMTGETSYTFTYNVNTSNGKLSTVTDAAGNKVFLLRDYTTQVNSIENTKGQKCKIRMTRMKMLHELSTPDNYNVTFEYHGPTGLLKTKLDSTGRSYVYNYDEFGRLTSAVTPTGRVIDLTFDLSVRGATIKVSENSQKEVSMLIQGSSVVVRNGKAETKTTVQADGSTLSVTPWNHVVSMEAVPYVLLAEINKLLGESYPVPSKQRVEVGGELANRFEWRFFMKRIQAKGKIPKGQPVPSSTTIGRKLRINGENILTLEYEQETKSVLVLVDDKIELLNVTYDRHARPTSFQPQSGEYAEVDLEYDRNGRLTLWKWGELKEEYSFDRGGRLNEIKYGDGSSIMYSFKDMMTTLPLKVTTPRRSDYLLQYDNAGALQSLTTPRGHIHSFSLQTSLGFFKYQYFSPINRHPFEILYNDDGQILAKIHPHQSGKVAYVYDVAGRLETILAGLSSTHYTYQDSSSLIKSVQVLEPGFELRREFKYHAGILRDEKLEFVSKSSLAAAHFKYQYDGNTRLTAIEMDIGGKELPVMKYKYGQSLGTLETVSDLKVTRNTANRTVVQDATKQFLKISDFDEHGRVKSVLINIKSADVFRLELDYDLRNRIKTYKTTIGRSTSVDKVNYNADGHVMEVVGTNNWKYVPDENGNIISILEQGDKMNLGYDTGDRVTHLGDVEFNSYDSRGYVVRRGEQKYRYNNRGQMIHAFERDKFQSWYFYDEMTRLVAIYDDKGNVTQFYYANTMTPNLVTHVHFPKAAKTLQLLYDDRNMLVAVETGEQRYYVATDQNGSPLAFVDSNGNVVKEVRRTPFGRTIKNTNVNLHIPIDFHGGILDPNTKLIYTENRLYDPTVGQWMTPLWEPLATSMNFPTDVFIYRFHNNDPINSKEGMRYMTDLDSWLALFGYDLHRMQGSKYTKDRVYQPQETIKSSLLAPDFGVMSGLQCIVEKIDEKFSDFGFVPKPLLKMEPKTRNLLPRIAYRRGVFGEGVLISRIDGRAMVSVVDGSNSVVQDVVSSVFNNSFFLDLHFSIHDQDVFYFVKDNVLKLRDDTEELRRLGGMFNTTTHEIADHGGAGGKELRLHGHDAVVIIKYGVDPEQERHRILKHAHKRAVERAWELEKQLVAAGFQGRGDWTEEEKEELISHGDVDGFIGVDIHSIHKYPELADDPGNVAFQRDSKRKRRKSGFHKTTQRQHRHET
ncbi:teneurin-m isoform X2 [Sitodiplosis mosellana]|uniref:teneurin-m isoform X2 n=1 Tax=Sitodiplosis mosellana TaxID=263140 RepID=UPI002444D980|nr:teneurin-m isoform X2 [Sitodiplosis mosellana]